MRIRSVFPIAVVVAGIMASACAYAAPTDLPAFSRVSFTKAQKNVNVALRNDSGSPLELKVGEQIMSIQAGKTVSLKIAVGTRIVMNAATSTHAAGELITEADAAMNNATIVVK